MSLRPPLHFDMNKLMPFYSSMSFSMSFSTSRAMETSPVFETRYLAEKFQVGLESPVASVMYLQTSGAELPLTLPSFISTPGNFLFAANLAISQSLEYSCHPNSWLGKARITRSFPHREPSFSKSLYSREVLPHLEATLVA